MAILRLGLLTAKLRMRLYSGHLCILSLCSLTSCNLLAARGSCTVAASTARRPLNCATPRVPAKPGGVVASPQPEVNPSAPLSPLVHWLSILCAWLAWDGSCSTARRAIWTAAIGDQVQSVHIISSFVMTRMGHKSEALLWLMIHIVG